MSCKNNKAKQCEKVKVTVHKASREDLVLVLSAELPLFCDAGIQGLQGFFKDCWRIPPRCREKVTSKQGLKMQGNATAASNSAVTQSITCQVQQKYYKTSVSFKYLKLPLLTPRTVTNEWQPYAQHVQNAACDWKRHKNNEYHRHWCLDTVGKT